MEINGPHLVADAITDTNANAVTQSEWALRQNLPEAYEWGMQDVYGVLTDGTVATVLDGTCDAELPWTASSFPLQLDQPKQSQVKSKLQ